MSMVAFVLQATQNISVLMSCDLPVESSLADVQVTRDETDCKTHSRDVGTD